MKKIRTGFLWFWKKWWGKFLLFFFLILVLLFSFRYSIMRGMASFLISENELKKSDLLVVLSGEAFDRGNEAAKIFKAGFTKEILCTGGNPPHDLNAWGIPALESDVTQKNLLRAGIPDSLIHVVHEGTSTKEEVGVVLNFCRKNKISSVIILSSKLHTRRVRACFADVLKKNGIAIIVRGAPSCDYSEMRWWDNENGLIAFSDEWMKTIYYWLKY